MSPVRRAALGSLRSTHSAARLGPAARPPDHPSSLVAEFGRYRSGSDIYTSRSCGYDLLQLVAQGSEGDVGSSIKRRRKGKDFPQVYSAAFRADTTQPLCIKMVKLRSAAVRRHARQEVPTRASASL